MKKIILILLAMIMLTGCGGTTEESVVENDTTVVEDDATEEIEGEQFAEVEENLTNVEYTLSSDIIGTMTTEEADAIIAANEDITAVVINEDGSATFTITKDGYEGMIANMKEQLEGRIDELVGDKDTVYINGIDYDDDYSEIVIRVDREAYESSIDAAAVISSLAYEIAYSKQFIGMENSLTITIIDDVSGDGLEFLTYPDSFE